MKNELFTTSPVNDVLQSIVGLPLSYAIKSPDTGLYDFGFGLKENNKKRQIPMYALHVICNFKVISKGHNKRVDVFYGNTLYDKFNTKIKDLIGLPVKRITLSEKNDLWLDFGAYWVVFATHENSEESWRLFSPMQTNPHLIASSTDIKLY